MLPYVGGDDVFRHVPIGEVQCEFTDLEQVHPHHQANLRGDPGPPSLRLAPGSLHPGLKLSRGRTPGLQGVVTSTAALISDKAEDSSGP